MTTTWAEYAATKFAPPTHQWDTPGELAKQLNPPRTHHGKTAGTIATPALDLIDAALVRAANTPDSRLIITMAPQEGKSMRVAGDFPIWLLASNPDLRIVSASYGQALANRNGRAIRNRIVAHPEIGLKIAPDNGSASEWQIAGHDGGVLSVGIGAGVTGRAADLLIIDDPIKDRAQADSKTYRDNVWDWWTDAASARLAPGAPVVMILTRWHHDDLAGRLLDEEGSEWELLNIPAQADHNPDKGEVDVLGRAPGEFMDSARKRTPKQWAQRKRAAGSRSWASLYQGRPTPDAGNLFPSDGWARYDKPMWIVRDDGAHIVPELGYEDAELLQSWDFTFKDTDHSDYVVGQVWLRRGPHAYLLDQVRGRWGFTASCQAMLNLTGKWPQATAKLVEDKANGTAIMNALRSQVGGLIPVEPEGSKYARATAVTPLVESHNVHLPNSMLEGCAWVSLLTEEARDFPNGAHDDTVDGLSQAVHRLLLVPMMNGETFTTDDLDDTDLDLGWSLSY